MEKEASSKSRSRPGAEMTELILFSVLIGVVAGLTAVLYRAALGVSVELRAGLYALGNSAAGVIALFVVLAAAGYIVGRIAEGEPFIMGGGIPQLKGLLKGYFSPCWWKALMKKFICGVLGLFAGLSLGRKGPSIQMGALAAQGLCRGLKRSRPNTEYLLVCGGCAGLAAAFNAPLAGVLFALEEVHGRFSKKTLFPAMLSAVTADIVSKLCFGATPLMNLPAVSPLPQSYYLLYAAFGIVAGCLGALFNKSLFFTQDLYKKTGLPIRVRILIPFLLAGAVGLFAPDALGGGSVIIDKLALGSYALSAAALLVTIKFVFTMACVGSGAPGGIFFPLLAIGALLGQLFGGGCAAWLGLPEEFLLNFMLLGMAGLFASTVRAPLTGILLVVELSGSFNQLLGISIVCCVAALTANLLESPPVFDELLSRMAPDRENRAAEPGFAAEASFAAEPGLAGEMDIEE